MMQPKRTKYRKQFKGRNAGLAQRGSSIAFGEYGLKAVSRARMTARASCVARVRPGKGLFEMEGVTEGIAREAFRLAASKLSVDTLFVKRQVR